MRRLARTGRPSAKLLNRFLENPERFLWTILVGNTLANFIILSLVFIQIHEWLAGRYVWIVVSFAAAVFLFYTLLDLLPKMLFRAFPTQLCLLFAPFFKPVSFVLGILVALVEGISTALLRLTGGRAFTGRLFGNRDEMRAVTAPRAPIAGWSGSSPPIPAPASCGTRTRGTTTPSRPRESGGWIFR